MKMYHEMYYIWVYRIVKLHTHAYLAMVDICLVTSCESCEVGIGSIRSYIGTLLHLRILQIFANLSLFVYSVTMLKHKK